MMFYLYTQISLTDQDTLAERLAPECDEGTVESILLTSAACGIAVGKVRFFAGRRQRDFPDTDNRSR